MVRPAEIEQVTVVDLAGLDVLHTSPKLAIKVECCSVHRTEEFTMSNFFARMAAETVSFLDESEALVLADRCESEGFSRQASELRSAAACLAERSAL